LEFLIMKGKITRRAVEALQPGEQLWDSVVRGFGARRQTGDVFYLLRYRLGGAQRFVTIGRAGSPWTPDTARREAQRLLGQIVAGTDPGAKPPPAPETFGAALERYLPWKQEQVRPKSFEEIERHLRQHAPPLHRLSLGEIDRRAVAQLLGQIETASGKVSRNRVRSSINAMFRWANSEGLVDHNPVTGTGVAAEKTRDRVLSPAELSAIWGALPASQFGDIVRLLILTGQRRDEIGDLQWAEVVADTAGPSVVAAEGGSLHPLAAEGGLGPAAIVLGAERTKNGHQHTVPLSPAAAAIIARQPRRARRCVFGIAADGFSGWSQSKAALDARVGLAPWTLHDLRRTVATGMAELGVLPHIIETVLNHQSGHKGGVGGIYNRATYSNEVRAALELWADWVDGLTPLGATGNHATNVVALRSVGA
jgi:integrase